MSFMFVYNCSLLNHAIAMLDNGEPGLGANTTRIGANRDLADCACFQEIRRGSIIPIYASFSFNSRIIIKLISIWFVNCNICPKLESL